MRNGQTIYCPLLNVDKWEVQEDKWNDQDEILVSWNDNGLVFINMMDCQIKCNELNKNV